MSEEDGLQASALPNQPASAQRPAISAQRSEHAGVVLLEVDLSGIRILLVGLG